MEPLRRLGSTLGAGLLTTLFVTACWPQPVACPAIAAAPIVTIHITPDRAATLDPASLNGEACQDGECHGGPLTLLDDSGPNTQPGAKRAMIMMMTLTESPIDLTVSGANTSGQSIGTSHVRFSPRADYPWGPQCPKVLIAEATLGNQGLSAN
ncbi:MAG: hypothetical protein HOQ07_02270 [Sinomonas sp.]|nr:hypothetical protein [Sinomonas sp.]